MLGHPYDPWQRWTVIHAGELLPDGRERFRYRLILVARQNGKTETPVVLVPYWMFVERVPQILGTSTKINMAKKMWLKSRKLIEAAGLEELLPRRWYREANGEIEMFTPDRTATGEPWGSSYSIDASNEEGGRSLSVHRLILDELRQHHDYTAWGASVRTMGAIEGAQAWLLSNAGSDRSVVLNDLRDSVVEERPDGTEFVPHDPDTDIFLAEWSTPRDADPLDVYALAQANPNMNRRGQKSKDLLADARRAVKTGGAALTEFKTEVMCIRVRIMNPAIDPGSWKDCLDVGDLADARSRLVACIDLSLDGTHAVLAVAAVLPDGRVRVEAVHEWTGPDAAAQLERDVPGWTERLRPRKFGWIPTGPAAAVASKIADRRKQGVTGWPPRGVDVAEIRGELTAVCMGLVKEIRATTLAHSGQAMVNAQVDKAEKLKRGDGFVFTRTGGSVAAVYAIAGAVHLARTLPKPRKISRQTHSAQ
jgi:phage terminase large subunit-like protein